MTRVQFHVLHAQISELESRMRFDFRVLAVIVIIGMLVTLAVEIGRDR